MMQTSASNAALLAYEDAQKSLVAYVQRTRALLSSACEVLSESATCAGLPVHSDVAPDSLRVLGGDSHADASIQAQIAPHTLTSKFANTQEHLACLEKRILDKTCRILVAGDVNAGKSALINALLRRDLLPTDEQPTTCYLTEVVNSSNNAEREEIHFIPSVTNPAEPIRKHEISELAELARAEPSENDFFDAVDDFSRTATPPNDASAAATLRVFCDAYSNESVLVGNSHVDVRIIDSPGLNRDIQKTIELVMSQREIDVIVFLVSSENHMTLSSHEFLKKASEEKKYIFVVVSKMDRIKDKSRCKRRILSQINEVSPLTHARADQLVHFVAIPVETYSETDSACDTPAKTSDSSFGTIPYKNSSVSVLAHPSHAITQVEDALKVFILEKRAASKLSPAKTFLENLLSDLSSILARQLDHHRVAQECLLSEIALVSSKIAEVDAHRVETSAKIEETAQRACEHIEEIVEMRFAKLPDMLLAKARSGIVPYPGIFSIRSYLNNLKHYLVSTVHDEVDVCRALSNKEISTAWRAIRRERNTWFNSSMSCFSTTKLFSLPPTSVAPTNSSLLHQSILHFSPSRLGFNAASLSENENDAEVEVPYRLDYSANTSLMPIRYACSLRGLLSFQPSRLLWRREPDNGAPKHRRHIVEWMRSMFSPDAIPSAITCAVKRGTCMTSAILVGRTICNYAPSIAARSGVDSLGALGIISRFGVKKLTIIAVATAGIAATFAGVRYVIRLSERIPEYMAHSLLEHLRESRYAESLGRHVCDAAQQALSLSLSEANASMETQVISFKASQASLESELNDTISRMDKIDEIKGRSEVALEQISFLSVEI